MITIDLSILNQKGTPMFYSDIFAARPPFGIAGRIFISTDTKEFYRDTGTAWELLAGPGGGTITGSGTTGTLPIFTGSSTIGDSSLLEGANKFTTTKDFQADAIYLNSMTGGAGALYYSGNRLTLANYNASGDVMIEANSGASAQFISGTNLSTTFYGNIIRNGGLSTQFLKADGSLDSTAYQPLLTNPVTGTGAATQVAFWSSGTALSGNNDLWWDNSNSRLGIGNNTPATQLDIHGNNATIQIDGRSTSSAFVQFVTQGVSKWRIGNLSPSNYFQIYDNANSLERIKLENTGLLTLTGNMTNVLTQTATGGSGWYGIFSNENITIPASTTFSGGNSFSSVNGKNGMTFAGSATFGLDNVPSGILSTNILSFSSAGSTITINQAGGVRAMSAITAFNQINSTNNGTISHIAGLQVIAPYSGAGTLTAANYYGLLLNASNERTAFTITNSWGIYQEGNVDKNYFNGTTLIGTNVDNLTGAKLQVSGLATFSLSISAAQFNSTSSTAATPAFAVSSNNGMYNGGANTIGWAINGSQAMTLNSSGNLGLGVTPSAWYTPSTSVLQIRNSAIYASGNATVITSNQYLDSGTIYRYISNDFASDYYQASGQHVWRTAPSGTAGNAITFTQAMTLDASGRLGIGISTFPNQSGGSLSGTGIFNGIVRISGSSTRFFTTGNGLELSVNSIYSYNRDTSAYNDLGINDAMTIKGAGNVGIGTASPTNKLHVVGGRAYIEAANEIYTLGLSRIGANAYYLGISNSVSPDLYFSNNAGTTRVTFTDGGNVGIGTATPAVKLHIVGGGEPLRIESTNGTGGTYLQYKNATGDLGYIGWGSTGVNDLYIYNQMNANMLFWTNAVERMRITPSGRTLIGTTTDNTIDLLQVEGSVSLKTNLKMASMTTSGTAGSIVNYVQVSVNGTNYLLPLYNLP